MSIEATVKTQGGATLESTGLNRLDVVKHAIRTIATTLGESDELAIVSFAATASVALPLTPMSPEGERRLNDTLSSLHPGGGTNLWAGLEKAFSLFGDRCACGHDSGCMLLLLTDGQPNICEHADGELGALEDYLVRGRSRGDSNGGGGGRADGGSEGHSHGVTVSTFGFGYDLNSALLLAIARRCGGSYTFVPDAGFVGALFAVFHLD